MPLDILIVGQGLAGSLLAWELIQAQYKVVVLDNGQENTSQVAAGLINPVTGQRLVKNRDIERFLASAMNSYRQLSTHFGKAFFVPLPMLRLFKNSREQAFAERRLSAPEYQAFLQTSDNPITGLEAPFGLLYQQQTGYLRTCLLLESLRDFFTNQGVYRKTELDYREIALHPELSWRDLKPKHIVFCEGHHAVANPWFGQLPFQPAKGQIITCRTTTNLSPHILNFGHWLIPTETRQFKVGATFEPEYTDSQPSAQATQTLLQSLRTVYPALSNIELVHQQAGIRPTTLDKQPFIGPHPRHPQLHIFNGFGAKGSLAIPYYAQRFVAALRQQQTLPEHCHIQRYAQTHFPV